MGTGVGGKIVKTKRHGNSTTPYNRPYSPTSTTTITNTTTDDLQNPNWLSNLIYPAKFVAGKFFSFFANYDDHDYDYHDFSSDSDNDGDDEIDNDASFHDDQIEKVLSPFSKSDNKRAIEQLVMQETYSRKEANELIKLVKSRILDSDGNIDETTPNMRSTAIMEAKKWLQEKRSGSKKQLENELNVSNMASSQILRSEKGSPVDMARSYMQSRPAWASPSSLKKFEAGNSSPLGMLHFKDETPMSTLRSSELKKSLYTSGSWNLLDEIRRVRSRATEELLAAAPLTKTTLSSLSTESNQRQLTLKNKQVAEGSGLPDSTHYRSEIIREATADAPSRDKDAGQLVEFQESEEAAVKQPKSTTAENGFGSASGVAIEADTSEARPSEEENGNLVDLSQGGHDTDMENLISPEEPAIHMPTEDFVDDSQNSSSMQDDLSQDFSQPVAKDDQPVKANDTQKEKKSRANTRRGRGRGK